MNKRAVTFLFISAWSLPALATVKVEGAIDISYLNVNNADNLYKSWQEQGTGLLRYDESSSSFDFRQGFFEADVEITDELHGVATAYAHSDGEDNVGITEAFISYKPLSQGWSKRFRLGVFYPHFSAENVATGWQSPYTYTYSTINSWVAEELRINGAEAEFTRLGRRHRQSFDISIVGGLYAGNDPLGTILSWRGWANHDRQTLVNERVEMANYPTINNMDFPQPSWVEPFQEVDDRLGYYVGIHYKQSRKHDIRAYWYDNRGEPLEFDPNMQYSWKTKFGSLAWKYNIDKSTTLLSQVVSGSTKMGGYLGVDVDFFSSYLMLSKKTDLGRISARIERFSVSEQDGNVPDQNDSDGHSLTLAIKQPIFSHVTVGVEYLYVDSYNENRSHWDISQQHSQQQWQLVFTGTL